jgi:hypothetical protein
MNVKKSGNKQAEPALSVAYLSLHP